MLVYAYKHNDVLLSRYHFDRTTLKQRGIVFVITRHQYKNFIDWKFDFIDLNTFVTGALLEKSETPHTFTEEVSMNEYSYKLLAVKS